MKPSIQSITIEDYEEVFQLWQQTEGVGLNESDTRENIALYLRRNPGMSFVSRDEAGKIIGTILGGHDGRRGYLHHLAVIKTARGKGLGRSLVEACLDAFKREGITRCNIFVYGNNEEGQAFWRHFGWKPRTELVVMQKQF